jgi:glycerol-3-phosphate dehydrogenase (NAD(P)+)
MSANVAVLGGGAWGTAFAIHVATRTHARPRVTLYMRNAADARATLAVRENRRYLPGITLPAGVEITSNLTKVRADLLFAATPVAELTTLRTSLAQAGVLGPIISLSKGFVEAPSRAAAWVLPHQALAADWPLPVGAVSGPTFAVEVARGLPTALVVATTDAALTRDVADLLRGETLRAYASDDLTGVEVGAAVKNVLAIAAGASDGLGFGDNARAALVTRGLAESGRLSAALGGRRETLMGLAGLGDLVLTCTGDLSRNRHVGIELARGRSLHDILAGMKMVAEGVRTTHAALALGAQFGVELPIATQMAEVFAGRADVRSALDALMLRRQRAEAEAQ